MTVHTDNCVGTGASYNDPMSFVNMIEKNPLEIEPDQSFDYDIGTMSFAATL